MNIPLLLIGCIYGFFGIASIFNLVPTELNWNDYAELMLLFLIFARD